MIMKIQATIPSNKSKLQSGAITETNAIVIISKVKEKFPPTLSAINNLRSSWSFIYFSINFTSFLAKKKLEIRLMHGKTNKAKESPVWYPCTKSM